MSFLHNIKSLRQQVAALPKLYHSHLWITPPASHQLSFLGISEFAKRHFVRINRFNLDGFTKTNYAIRNRSFLDAFIAETTERRERGELTTAERIEWERFTIKKNQPFAILQTIEFEVEMLAPVDLRVIAMEVEVNFDFTILSAPYMFEVEVLLPLQLEGLLSEEEYVKSRKMFML